MGNNTKVLTTLLSFFLAIVLAFAQFDTQTVPGKPCSSAFHCWRTEPLTILGEPAALQGLRRKRLEVGSSFRKGGRCRCVDGSCSLYQQATSSFLPCEEF